MNTSDVSYYLLPLLFALFLRRRLPGLLEATWLLARVAQTLEHDAQAEQTERPHDNNVLDAILKRRATNRVPAVARLGQAAAALDVIIRFGEVVETQVLALGQRLQSNAHTHGTTSKPCNKFINHCIKH